MATATLIPRGIDDKLRILDYVPEGARKIVDAGAGDGLVAQQLAIASPEATVYGLDKTMSRRGYSAPNLLWVQGNLAFGGLLQEELDYPDAIVFSSVLHEVGTLHGPIGIVSALTDACKVLAPGGRIIIRDMGSEKHAGWDLPKLSILKVREWAGEEFVSAYEKAWGSGWTNPLNNLLHFILHAQFKDNPFELDESYFCVQSKLIKSLLGDCLGMRPVIAERYTLPHIEKLLRSFGVSAREAEFVNTHQFHVYEKAGE